jgi:thioredoxin-like negative regulator of GroEL
MTREALAAMIVAKSNPAVSMLYFRPSHAGCTLLDGRLFEIAARNRGRVRLVVKHTDESGSLFGGWVSGRAPTVLFVRDGRMVAQFVGDVPSLEIERLLRASLSPVTDDVAPPVARSA